MALPKGKWIRRNRLLFLIVLLMMMAGIYILFQQELKINEMKRELVKYESIRDQLLDVRRQLERQVEQLDSDQTKESLAREKLNMLRTDEIMYIIKYPGVKKHEKSSD